MVRMPHTRHGWRKLIGYKCFKVKGYTEFTYRGKWTNGSPTFQATCINTNEPVTIYWLVHGWILYGGIGWFAFNSDNKNRLFPIDVYSIDDDVTLCPPFFTRLRQLEYWRRELRYPKFATAMACLSELPIEMREHVCTFLRPIDL